MDGWPDGWVGGMKGRSDEGEQPDQKEGCKFSSSFHGLHLPYISSFNQTILPFSLVFTLEWEPGWKGQRG